jgi:Rieske Fe-S protein
VDRDRRRICKAGLALGAAAVLPACGNSSKGGDMGDPCQLPDSLNVGNAADVPVNGAVNVPTSLAKGDSVFLCRDADGYYCVDAGCTHLGCDVALAGADVTKGFACPCHGATYDANGQNPTAPAPSPLVHYRLCAEPSGALSAEISDAGIVDPKVRIKV